MKKPSFATAATLFALSITSAYARSLPADDRVPGPVPNIQFVGSKGVIQSGTRCAAQKTTASQAKAVHAQFSRFLRENGRRAPSQDLLIPIVWHVVHDGANGNVPDAMIEEQVAVLNDAFQNRGFAFLLQSVVRTDSRKWFTGCYSQERNMKRELAVDVPHTLNIYSCQPKGGILGFAYMPWGAAEDSSLHGVVVHHATLPGGGAVPYDEGDTATHEVGHYLGLEHTFYGGCTGTGDDVDDTPAEKSAAFGCPTGRDTCPSAGLDPITNYMDYTDDACMFEFSPGQDARMQWAVATYKPNLGN